MMSEVSEQSLHIYGVQPRRTEFTVKEYAAVEGVTERTVRNWVDKKAVTYRRTPSGRVRIIVTTKP